MLTSSDQLLSVARRLYPQDLPRPFQVLDAALHVLAGADPRGLAKGIGTTAKRLEAVALADDPVAARRSEDDREARGRGAGGRLPDRRRRVRGATAGFRRQIADADWFALSARRADLLLRDRLFDRVYAVRVRAFARNYPNAELDMHFSLREDLTPLQTFLATAKDRGLHGLSVDLERGVL